MSDATRQLVENLNALATGLFLLTAFGIVAMRQARDCLHLFIAQSVLLAASVLVSTLLAIAQNADAFRQLNPHLWQQLNNGFR